MQFRIRSDSSCLTAPEARSWAGGHFWLSDQGHHQDIPYNGPIYSLVKIQKNVLSSAAEAEVGALYLNAKEAIPIRMALQELGHPQQQTPITTDNSTAMSIANNECKQIKMKTMDMHFYWLRDTQSQDQFKYLWCPANRNLGDYYTKHHPVYHHQNMRPIYLHTKRFITAPYAPAREC